MASHTLNDGPSRFFPVTLILGGPFLVPWMMAAADCLMQTRARLSIYEKKQNGGSDGRFSDWISIYDFHILLLGFFGLDFELFFVLCFPKFAGFVLQVFSNTWVPKGTGLPGDHEIRW
jgi:hypothetical protein